MLSFFTLLASVPVALVAADIAWPAVTGVECAAACTAKCDAWKKKFSDQTQPFPVWKDMHPVGVTYPADFWDLLTDIGTSCNVTVATGKFPIELSASDWCQYNATTKGWNMKKPATPSYLSEAKALTPTVMRIWQTDAKGWQCGNSDTFTAATTINGIDQKCTATQLATGGSLRASLASEFFEVIATDFWASDTDTGSHALQSNGKCFGAVWKMDWQVSVTDTTIKGQATRLKTTTPTHFIEAAQTSTVVSSFALLLTAASVFYYN